MLGPRIPVRERILGVGAAGSGKSTACLDIAIKIPETTVYVMDAEYGGAWTPNGGRMNPGGELANIVAKECTEWEQFAKTAKEFKARGKVHDWLVVDLVGTAYDMVQEYYIEKVKGVKVDEFYESFAEKRASSSKNMSKSPFEGDTDWQYIKRIYNAVMSDILNFPGHVIALAGVKPPPRDEYDDKQAKQMFSHLGVRPEGHKKLSNLFSTILFFRESKRGEWAFTTVRERNSRLKTYQREYVENLVWDDFAKSYLWNIAGWRPGWKAGGQ